MEHSTPWQWQCGLSRNISHEDCILTAKAKGERGFLSVSGALWKVSISSIWCFEILKRILRGQRNLVSLISVWTHVSEDVRRPRSPRLGLTLWVTDPPALGTTLFSHGTGMCLDLVCRCIYLGMRACQYQPSKPDHSTKANVSCKLNSVCVCVCGCTTFLACPDLSSPTRDGPYDPAVKAWSPNHWTAREVPKLILLQI